MQWYDMIVAVAVAVTVAVAAAAAAAARQSVSRRTCGFGNPFVCACVLNSSCA
jgi:hypothetical protein